MPAYFKEVTMMEEKLFRYLSKVGADKLRLTELIAHFTHDVTGSEKENLIFKRILPALINMEKDSRIQLSWDVMLSRYRFPRYIYCKPETAPASARRPLRPLWQRQVEEILKQNATVYSKKAQELRLQDKFERFVKRYEKSAEDINPSEDWVKVITAFMESNLSQYDVMRACIEAFKAGAIWERYRKEFGG
jgi:hypothetical protein